MLERVFTWYKENVKLYQLNNLKESVQDATYTSVDSSFCLKPLETATNNIGQKYNVSEYRYQ